MFSVCNSRFILFDFLYLKPFSLIWSSVLNTTTITVWLDIGKIRINKFVWQTFWEQKYFTQSLYGSLEQGTSCIEVNGVERCITFFLHFYYIVGNFCMLLISVEWLSFVEYSCGLEQFIGFSGCFGGCSKFDCILIILMTNGVL